MLLLFAGRVNVVVLETCSVAQWPISVTSITCTQLGLTQPSPWSTKAKGPPFLLSIQLISLYMLASLAKTKTYNSWDSLVPVSPACFSPTQLFHLSFAQPPAAFYSIPFFTFSLSFFDRLLSSFHPTCLNTTGSSDAHGSKARLNDNRYHHSLLILSLHTKNARNNIPEAAIIQHHPCPTRGV